MSAQHAGGPAVAHHAELDAEHAPETARRASLAGLRRDAAGSQRAPTAEATPADAQKQRDKADNADLHGLQSSITLVAKHMQTRAAAIHKLTESPTHGEAGASPAIQAIEQHIASTASEVDVLSSRMRDMNVAMFSMPSDSAELSHEIGMLKTGMILFDAAVQQGRLFARTHGQPIAAATVPIDRAIVALQAKVTRQTDPPKQGRTGIDDRSEATVTNEAMDMNLIAAHEAAVSARMGLPTASNDVVVHDLIKLSRHLCLVSDILGQATDKKTAKLYKQRLRGLLAEVRQLQSEARWEELKRLFESRTLVMAVVALQQQAGHA